MQIEAKIFCIIETLDKKQIEFSGTENIKNEIERFFISVEETNQIQIISIDKILRKCIKIVIDSDIYLTYCVDAQEHD